MPEILKREAVPQRIGFLLIDGFALMSYASAVEPLRAANLLAGKKLYEVSNFALNGKQAVSSNGTIVPSNGSLQNEIELDVLLVVAGGETNDILNTQISSLLRKLDKRKVVLGGVSGGPLLLAAAGLMTGRRMTAHWEHLPTLEQMSSSIVIERSLFVIDRNRITCAGGTAPMDMVHSLITQTFGPVFARTVSDWFLHTEVRPSESAQRSGLIERYGTNNGIIIDTIRLMQNNLGDPLTLDELANLVSVGPRQLNRLFGGHLNRSAMAFYRDLRLEQARKLIRNSTLSMTEIALATGFSSSAHFSTAFRNKYNYKPIDERSG